MFWEVGLMKEEKEKDWGGRQCYCGSPADDFISCRTPPSTGSHLDQFELASTLRLKREKCSCVRLLRYPYDLKILSHLPCASWLRRNCIHSELFWTSRHAPPPAVRFYCRTTPTSPQCLPCGE